MADIFISYANEDREHASELASALEERGWTVWWDRKIVAGQSFDEVIEREIEAARCVVVLWSIHAIASDWVKNEATVAMERGMLVPALIDDVRPPLEFRRKQTASLIEWRGKRESEGFRALCDGIAAATDTAGTIVPGPTTNKALIVRANRSRIVVVVAVAAVVASIIAYHALVGAPKGDDTRHVAGSNDRGNAGAGTSMETAQIAAVGSAVEGTLTFGQPRYYRIDSGGQPVVNLAVYAQEAGAGRPTSTGTDFAYAFVDDMQSVMNNGYFVVYTSERSGTFEKKKLTLAPPGDSHTYLRIAVQDRSGNRGWPLKYKIQLD